MKHPIATVGKVPGLKETLLAFIRELRDTQCEAAEQDLATVAFDEEITVTVELVASGGLNAIERIAVSKSGAQVKRDILPLIKETTLAGEEISEEKAAATTMKEDSENKHEQYTISGTSGVNTSEVDSQTTST